MPCPPLPSCTHPRRRLTVALLALGLGLVGGSWAQPAPPVDPPRGAVRVVVFGDFNGPYGSVTYPSAVARVMDAIVGTWRPDLVLFPGDVVAGQSTRLPDARFAEMWSAFDAAVAAPLRSAGIPYAVALGNHDASKLRDGHGHYAFAREREAALAYWRDAAHVQGLEVVEDAAYPFAWSFRLGPLAVAVIDASGPVLDTAERVALVDTLERDRMREASLRWVVGHLPLVGIAEGRARAGEVLWQAHELRDLLVDGGVDTYVSGHQAAFYAGRWAGLELLSGGGVGARRLLGSDGPPRSTVSVVDLWWQPTRVAITTYDVADLQRRPIDDLPVHLDGFGGRLERSERVR